MKVKILFIKLLFNSGLKNPESMWTNKLTSTPFKFIYFSQHSCMSRYRPYPSSSVKSAIAEEKKVRINKWPFRKREDIYSGLPHCNSHAFSVLFFSMNFRLLIDTTNSPATISSPFLTNCHKLFRNKYYIMIV